MKFVEQAPRAAPTLFAGWRLPAGTFFFVALVQLWLVSRAGTDIPFQDQWDIEGRWLFPKWQEGSLHGWDLLTPFNEHRILWTHLLNLSLFVANGQWDPRLELIAIAVLRAGCAGGLTWLVGQNFSPRRRVGVALAIAVAFLPHLAWHNVLWGIESHAYFVLGFSLAALAMLGVPDRPPWQTGVGLAAGLAALFAMGPGALVPVPLGGLAALRMAETRRFDRGVVQLALPAAVLLLAGFALRASVPAHAELKAANAFQFLAALGRLLAWPHPGGVLAAVPMNLPLVMLVGARVARQRRPVAGEDFLLLAGGWSAAIVLGTAWMRGGSPELVAGVPSRYVDFIVLLPLANLGAVGLLATEATARWRKSVRLLSVAWGAFLVVGWLGLSSEVMRRVVWPRVADRAAPIRLVREFQESGNAAVFDGQPRLLVPHPNPAAVQAVLHDPRLRGKLPPSLQPEHPPGPLSRAARWLLRQ